MQLTGEAPALAVSVEDYRRATGFIEADAEADLLIESYLRAAQEVVEAGTNRLLGRRSVRLVFDARPRLLRWWFPCAPVAEVTGVKLIQGAAETIIALPDLGLRMLQDEPQILFPLGTVSGGPAVIEVEAVVGADRADARLQQAIILIAKDWREANIAIDQTEYTRASFGCRALMKQARYQRPAVTEDF
ncbi:MAG: hypothetical protein GYB53_17880 [Rhodobacteraceae bacterium]|nr:hypothetical protein [Paracoccaceae bacterium]MBR9821928.1 hypothetical protein [Paracoccaceae bacterium]